MTLTEFLLARIAEDEAVAREVRPDEYLTTRNDFRMTSGMRGEFACVAATSARVLTECAAKRQIVERYAHLLEHGDSGDAKWVLPLLVLPYADHSDYDEWWTL